MTDAYKHNSSGFMGTWIEAEPSQDPTIYGTSTYDIWLRFLSFHSPSSGRLLYFVCTPIVHEYEFHTRTAFIGKCLPMLFVKSHSFDIIYPVIFFRFTE